LDEKKRPPPAFLNVEVAKGEGGGRCVVRILGRGGETAGFGEKEGEGVSQSKPLPRRKREKNGASMTTKGGGG